MTFRGRGRSLPAHPRALTEPLESRLMLSASRAAAPLPLPKAAAGGRPVYVPPPITTVAKPPTDPRAIFASPIGVKGARPYASSPPGSALTPSKVRHAYGIDQILYGSIVGDGTGQTIAIVDAYHYPTALTDLQAFDAAFGLPDPPSFRVVAQDGSTNYPTTDPAGPGNANGTWELEEALDVQWVHAIAPGASIILVECASPSYANLIQAGVNWARSQPGVVAVSMSFGGGEFSTETSLDTYFTTPAGHTGVTFLASTGDTGQPGGYPAYSPNVVAVGGTTLTLSGNNYASESAWSGSGGGISLYEAQPNFQKSVVTQSTSKRTTPDVAMEADPNTGVAIYDSWDYPSSPWIQIGGTSLSAPMWAGLVAIADQGRALAGLGSLDGPSQTLPALYSISSGDYHDVTTGNNGFAAGAGYDLVTGRGTPIANVLVYDLAGIGTLSGRVFEDRNASGTFDALDAPQAGTRVYLDANNNGQYDGTASGTFASTDVPKSIPDNSSTGVTSALSVAGLIGAVTDINVTLSISHTRVSDLAVYLTAPDGTQVQLVSGVTGTNLTNTTLDDQAATSIAAGTAPYTGSFKPSPGALSSFNGKTAAGTWTLKVTDTRFNRTGTLDGWSVAITTGGETSALTDATGAYAFIVPAGTYAVRAVLPAGGIATTAPAAPAAPLYNATASGNVAGLNFAYYPTTFAAAPGGGFALGVDPTGTVLQVSPGTVQLPSPTYQLPLAALPALTFALGAGATLTADFTNGPPVPPAGLTVTSTPGTGATLSINGASPLQVWTMTDTLLSPDSAGPGIAFQVDTLSLTNCTVNYAGQLATLSNLIIGMGATFNWRFAF